MTTDKQRRIQQIRANSAYPVYRGVISIIAVLGYIQAIGIALTSVVGGISMMQTNSLFGSGCLLVGLIFSVMCFFFVRFYQEAALILADMGDAITDINLNQIPDR